MAAERLNDSQNFDESDYLVWLTDIGAGNECAVNDDDAVGGKATNLAAMTVAGFSVPAGFCVTTAAYRQSARSGGGLADVLAEFAGTRPDDRERLLLLAKNARAAIRAAAIPESIRDAVNDAYRRLGDQSPAVAVRSSALGEDLPDASAAGQYDTFLNVRGEGDVLERLRECWLSLWSDRAVLYRAARHQTHEAAAIAVVVQLMVDATSAGVLFTANPVTGKRTETVIEAIPGLGEGVVSGTVTPDRYIVDDTGIPDHTGGCLTAEQLVELHRIGAEIADHFGQPQDIEWAYDATGALWITQSRPITTLFPVPKSPDGTVHAYWSISTYQGLTQPFTPIGSWFIRHRQGSMRLRGHGIAADLPDVDGWVYWDITEGIRDESKRRQLTYLIDALNAPAGQLVNQLAADSRFPTVSGDPGPEPDPLGARARKVTTWLALLAPNTARKRIHRVAKKRVRAAAHPDFDRIDATPARRLDFVESNASQVATIERNLPRYASAGQVAEQLAKKILAAVADQDDFNAVFRGVPHNPTTDMDLELWRIAADIQRDSDLFEAVRDRDPVELAQAFVTNQLPMAVGEAVRGFLDRYGCRTTNEIDLGVPRWSDDPAPVFTMLVNYLAATGTEHDPAHRFRSAAQSAEATIDRIVGKLPRSRPLTRWFARRLLHRSRALRGLRELGKLCLVRGFAEMRAQLVAIGDALTSRGMLATAEDVMFLDPSEIRRALAGEDFRATVVRRRTTYARECARPRIPAIVLSDGTIPSLPTLPSPPTLSSLSTPASVEPETATTLAGIAAASGTVTGSARVVRDPTTARIDPGEILVATSTDPGWTPLFLTASALVTETGGMTSHGTTVAREYGIPAVIGVTGATDLIRTGDRVTVDGSTGTVIVAAATGVRSGDR